MSKRRPKARPQDGVPVVHDPALLESRSQDAAKESLNRAKVKARWRKTMPRWGQDGVKRAPREPKMGQDGTKMGPRASRGAKRGQDGAKMGPRWDQNGAKMGPKWDSRKP